MSFEQIEYNNNKFGYSNVGVFVILLCVIGIVLEYSNIYYYYSIDNKWNTVVVTNNDIDVVTRTVIGEAAKESNIGKIAVVYVILNRSSLNLKHFGGNNLTDISLKCSFMARGKICQFEPWMNRSKYLWSISENSITYKRVKKLVIDSLHGIHRDPTNGATHFLEPIIVTKRYGKLPSWANGGKRIGNHVFYRLEQ
jgi:N-acetylmuramoyl-L-alanine amidase